METNTQRAKKIIADTLGVDLSAVTPGAHLKKDLGADSLDIVELVMILEQEFNISIPDGQIERMKEVNHLIDYVSKTKPLPIHTYHPMAAA